MAVLSVNSAESDPPLPQTYFGYMSCPPNSPLSVSSSRPPLTQAGVPASQPGSYCSSTASSGARTSAAAGGIPSCLRLYILNKKQKHF